MKFKFPSRRYFYFNEKISQTSENGEYDPDNDSLDHFRRI